MMIKMIKIELNFFYRVVNVVVVSVAVLVRCPFILLRVSFNLNWNVFGTEKKEASANVIEKREKSKFLINPDEIERMVDNFKTNPYIWFLTWQFQTLHRDKTEKNNTNCVILVVIQIQNPSSLWPGPEFTCWNSRK